MPLPGVMPVRVWCPGLTAPAIHAGGGKADAAAADLDQAVMSAATPPGPAPPPHARGLCQQALHEQPAGGVGLFGASRVICCDWTVRRS